MGAPWTNTYEAVLRAHARFLEPGQALDPEVALVDLGIDSLATVEMLLEIEDALGLDVPDELLTPDVFRSPGTLWLALAPLIGTQTPSVR